MPPIEPVVSLVAVDAVDRVIGARNRAERVVHLRRLRDEGRIFTDKGRLTQTLARGTHGLRRAYVFRCRASEIPSVSRESRAKAKPTGKIGRVLAV